MDNRVVYIVYGNRGTNTRPVGSKYASYDKSDAEAHATEFDYILHSVVDVDAHRAKVVAAVKPLDLLVLGLPQPTL